MSVQVFGIRHHGPGSSRSLCQALEEFAPQIVLIEGPPEGDSVLGLVTHKEMKPPVALLVYAAEEPSRAVYYPFAVFSPEWQAITYGLENKLPVRFIDMPMTHALALDKANEALPADSIDESEEPAPDSVSAPTLVHKTPAEIEEARALRRDPLLAIARAAGYDDGERWWEHMVEERRDGGRLFEGIQEAMIALRQALSEERLADDPQEQKREAIREAFMREGIRTAQSQGYEKIAVVCGAWHVPALVNMPDKKRDKATLSGLAKIKVQASWVPWTHGRLSFSSGYGAGVTSPGWYLHLWNHPEQSAVHWMTRVARLLRDAGIDAPSANVIEAVRLAETLAAMRGRPLAGLQELMEATQAAILFGDSFALRLISEQLIVGQALGEVPADSPQTPLQKDLAQLQKKLRIKPEPSEKELKLDLREDLSRQRSCLLRRLALLGVPWGKGGTRGAGKGTFWEVWQLKWDPEFAVSLIEAGVYGNTIEQAATSLSVQNSQKAPDLPSLTLLVKEVVLADLPEAVDAVVQKLQAEAAISSDLTHLMGALPELAQLLRYGDVRKTETATVETVVQGLVARICVGLPAACAALNEEAAEEFFKHLVGTQSALSMLENQEYLSDWYQTLSRILDQDSIQGLLRGRACRLLLDAGLLSHEEVAGRFSLALSVANDPSQSAAWVEGFLRGSGQILIYDELLWQLLDRWLVDLSAEAYMQLLPVLRRTFSSFSPPERRQMGERARHHIAAGKRPGPAAADESDIDIARAEAVLPLVSRLLGLEERA